LLTRLYEANRVPVAAILGWGAGIELQSALSPYYSQGRGRLAALQTATTMAAVTERAVDWVVSNDNGERYAAWESMLARGRFYRSQRDRLPTTYPAMSVGETGAAGGTLALIAAAHGFVRGYAPGTTAMIELASEDGARTACVVRATSQVTRP
jgi:3-oxoacyl-[acyl-carrier-protein] synthase-1